MAKSKKKNTKGRRQRERASGPGPELQQEHNFVAEEGDSMEGGFLATEILSEGVFDVLKMPGRIDYHIHKSQVGMPPIEWGEYPRVRVWTAKRLNEARLEDKYGKNGDYGKLGCMSVPYGSKHPFVPEDTMGPEGGGSHDMAYEVAKIVLSGMGIDGAAAGVGAGHAAYESTEEEELPLKRRKRGRVDKKYFSKLRVELQALLSEEDMSSGEDDVDWEANEDGESELESLVDSDEVWFSEDDVDDDWVPGVEFRGSSVDKSVTKSDVKEEEEEEDTLGDDYTSQRGDGEVDNHTEADAGCRKVLQAEVMCPEGGSPHHEELPEEVVVNEEEIVSPVIGEEALCEDQRGGEKWGKIVIMDEGVPVDDLFESDEGLNDTGLGQLVNKICDDAFELNNLGGGGVETFAKDECMSAQQQGLASPPPEQQVVGKLLSPQVDEEVTNEELPVGGASPLEAEQVEAQAAEEHEGGSSPTEIVNDPVDDGVEPEQGPASPEEQVKVEAGVSVGQHVAVRGVKSRTRRGKKISSRLKDKDFETVLIPRQHRHMRTRIVKFLAVCGRRQNFRVLLRCDSQEANVLNCRSMLCEDGGVDDNYVRTVAKLYTMSWGEKYKGCSIRVMLDPTIAIRLLRETSEDTDDWITTRRVAKSAAKGYVGVPANRFFVVFVPVLEKGHWWCVGFCLNSEQIWVMDSMARAPVLEHQSVIHNLCFVVDTFLWACDKSWVVGNLVKWDKKAIKVVHQEDGFSCGVYMLAAVDKCAERFIDVDFDKPIEEEREWFLTYHLMSEFNEAKDEMKEIVEKTVGNTEWCSEDDA